MGIINEVAESTLKRFAEVGLKETDLAMTLVQFEDGKEICQDYRGNERIYPASIVKLFYLAAVHQWLEDRKLEVTEELDRAATSMIVESSNDATNYLVDLLTDTTSGPELSEEEAVLWRKKRNRVNEYLVSLGYQNFNVNQKTWGDGPFGRERVFLGLNFENRNYLTTNVTAHLLSAIVQGKCVSASRSQQMLSLMERDYTKPSTDPDDQATCFSGKGLPAGCKLWSKAGWTSTARHDAIYVELPNNKRLIFVIFTLNCAKQYEIIPFAASEVIKRL